MQKKMSVLCSLLGSFALGAQETEAAPKLKGVLLVDDSSKVRSADLNQITGIQLDGVEVKEGDLQSELTPFLSDLSLTAEGMQKLCDAIATHYRESEDLRVSVAVADQNAADGVVQLVVAPEKLGEVNVKANRYTEAQTLKQWVRLSSNDPINEKTLAQDVGWMNTNPYRSVNVAYQPGAKQGETNVDLIVSDKKNWKVSSGVDNTGTDPVGPLRVFADLNVNHFIFTDHTLKLKATTADRYSELQSYSAEYVAPLPWRNTVRVFGSYTETTPYHAVTAEQTQKHRQNYQASARYAVPHWFGSNLWIDQVTFEAGADFKGSNTNVLYQDRVQDVEKKLAYVGQLVGSVSGQRVRGSTKITAGADFIGSPARILPHQTDADFDNLRLGATPVYFYSKLALTIDQKLPASWKLSFQGRAQLSPSTLIPSEQFALGGYSTIRGYQEKAVNGDNALCGNLEIKTPDFGVVSLFVPKFGDSLTFLGFVDGGYAWLNEAVANAPMQQTLLGAGPGVRYSISSYFSSRLDVGFPLLKVGASEISAPRVHFNAILSY